MLGNHILKHIFSFFWTQKYNNLASFLSCLKNFVKNEKEDKETKNYQQKANT